MGHAMLITLMDVLHASDAGMYVPVLSVGLYTCIVGNIEYFLHFACRQ